MHAESVPRMVQLVILASPKASDSLMRAESVPSMVRLVVHLSLKNSPSSHFLTFLSSTLPTCEDNSPARRASIIHVSPASSGLSFLNIVFIPSIYPLSLSFFHPKTTLVIFFLHSFPSIKSMHGCILAFLLSSFPSIRHLLFQPP